MNALLVDQFGDIGGGQQCFLDLLPALQASGWKVHAALPADGRYKTRLEAAGVETHKINCGPYHSGKKSLGDVVRFALDFRQQCHSISRLLSSDRFDVVYVNGPRVLPAVAQAAGRRVPVIFHAHNYIGTGAALALTGRSLRSCGAHVVACCEFIAEPLRAYVPGDHIRVVPNGTPDMRIFQRSCARERTLAVGMIGRIEPQKGQLEFLRAVALLASQGLETRSIICGSETSQYQIYGAELKKLGGTLNTSFLGWRDDVAPVLNDLDLLVIASEREAFPRVMIEAFSAGVPVVAFPVGGIGEAVQDDLSGFLVSPRSAPALAARIRSLTNRAAELAKVATNARRLWEERYDISRYRNRIMEAFECAALSV
jgi:glycosyltransferase involved in cell wall biosynthesis